MASSEEHPNEALKAIKETFDKAKEELGTEVRDALHAHNCRVQRLKGDMNREIDRVFRKATRKINRLVSDSTTGETKAS